MGSFGCSHLASGGIAIGTQTLLFMFRLQFSGASFSCLHSSAGEATVFVDKRAGKCARAAPARVLWKAEYLEFTLPMLVIRNYVLEP